MSHPYGPFTVAVGNLADITTNQYPDAAAAVIINESPYTLKVNPGTGSYFIVSAFTQQMIPLGNQYSGVLKVSASADITFSGTAPASVLYVQMYAQGEQVLGTYPADLSRQVNVGGGSLSQATSVVQTNQPVPTPVVSATPQATFVGATQVVQINNDGSARFGGAHNPSPAIIFDGSGDLTVQGSLTVAGEPILATGSQLTGRCGGIQDNGIAGHIVGLTCNFGTKLTNVWSSITLAAVNFNNENGPTADEASVYGFRVLWSVAANGASTYTATFTTVGN